MEKKTYQGSRRILMHLKMCFDTWPVWGMLGVEGVVVVKGGREEVSVAC